jgi:hypothetical protein
MTTGEVVPYSVGQRQAVRLLSACRYRVVVGDVGEFPRSPDWATAETRWASLLLVTEASDDASVLLWARTLRTWRREILGYFTLPSPTQWEGPPPSWRGRQRYSRSRRPAAHRTGPPSVSMTTIASYSPLGRDSDEKPATYPAPASSGSPK